MSNLRSGIFIAIPRNSTKMVLPRLLLPAAVVVSQSSDNNNDNTKDEFNKVCKRSELPLYRKETKNAPQEPERTEEVGLFSDALDEVRSKLMSFFGEVKAYQQVAKDKLYVVEHKYDELRRLLAEEENYPPKAGAITVGALIGYILGLRGGKFKRFVYTSVGALAMASICFPNEAREYTKTGLAEAKRITKIAYGFAYGVKKDEPIEFPSISVPTSISETWEAISGFVKSSSSPSVTDNAVIGDIGAEVGDNVVAVTEPKCATTAQS